MSLMTTNKTIYCHLVCSLYSPLLQHRMSHKVHRSVTWEEIQGPRRDFSVDPDPCSASLMTGPMSDMDQLMHSSQVKSSHPTPQFYPLELDAIWFGLIWPGSRSTLKIK